MSNFSVAGVPENFILNESVVSTKGTVLSVRYGRISCGHAPLLHKSRAVENRPETAMQSVMATLLPRSE